MPTVDQRIESLELKLKQARAKKARSVAAKRSAEERLMRNQQTRRQVILGAIVARMMAADDALKNRITREIDAVLKMPRDRELFGLVVATEAAADAPQQKTT